MLQIGKYDSWIIKSGNKACKICDKSVFEYDCSGVPVGVREFFKVENIGIGDKSSINLCLNGITYKASISMDTTGRTKLAWHIDLKQELSKYFSIEDLQLMFERKSDNEYDLIMLACNDTFVISTDSELESFVLIKKQSGNVEGKRLAMYVTKYERNITNRKEAIIIHGLKCQVCNFDFNETYGKLGEKFIEVHHIKPLYDLEDEINVDPDKDLVCVCSNCHRMLHRKKNEVLTVEELKQIVEQRN